MQRGCRVVVGAVGALEGAAHLADVQVKQAESRVETLVEQTYKHTESRVRRCKIRVKHNLKQEQNEVV